MNHQEFVQAYQNGTLDAFMPQKTASAHLSRRLLLPFFMMPILGAGIALVLIGWIVTGIIVFVLGFIMPRLIKRNAVAILMYQALHDPDAYEELREAGVLEVSE